MINIIKLSQEDKHSKIDKINPLVQLFGKIPKPDKLIHITLYVSRQNGANNAELTELTNLLKQKGVNPSQIIVDTKEFQELAGNAYFNIYDSRLSKQKLEYFYQQQIRKNSQAQRLRQNSFSIFRLTAENGLTLDDKINLCRAAVAEIIHKYARKDANRTVDAWQGHHLRRLIEYANGSYNFVQLAFAIANSIHETNYFSEFVEPISALCRGYSGGCDYRGRGFTHLTNDYNYKTYGDLIGHNLVANPDFAANNAVAFLVMNAYFEKNGIQALLQTSIDFSGARRKINPGESLSKSIPGARIGTTVEKKINSLSNAMLKVLEGYANGDYLIQYKIEF